jgi:hypothetical protein
MNSAEVTCENSSNHSSENIHASNVFQIKSLMKLGPHSIWQEKHTAKLHNLHYMFSMTKPSRFSKITTVDKRSLNPSFPDALSATYESSCCSNPKFVGKKMSAFPWYPNHQMENLLDLKMHG